MSIRISSHVFRSYDHCAHLLPRLWVLTIHQYYGVITIVVRVIKRSLVVLLMTPSIRWKLPFALVIWDDKPPIFGQKIQAISIYFWQTVGWCIVVADLQPCVTTKKPFTTTEAEAGQKSGCWWSWCDIISLIIGSMSRILHANTLTDMLRQDFWTSKHQCHWYP